MRISLLVRREPFWNYLLSVIPSFFKEVYGHQCTVSTSRLYQRKSKAIFYCNSLLNAIFHSQAPDTVFGAVVKEYSRSTVAWRRLLQRLYIACAIRDPIRKILAVPVMCIDPPFPDLRSLLIMGGNHHIRINDYAQQKSFVVAKYPAAVNFIENEINLRKKNSWVPAPLLLQTGTTWYAEELVEGIPVNRLSSRKEGEQVERKIAAAMVKLYKDSGEMVLLNEYIAELCKKIVERSGSLTGLDEMVTADINSLAKDVAAHIDPKQERLMLAQTHGDYQPANMLLAGSRPLLIDWEYTAQRSVLYDFLTNYSRVREGADLSIRVKSLIDTIPEYFICLQDIVNLECVTYRKNGVLTFILEDLLLKLQENDNPDFRNTTLRLQPYVARLISAFEHLKI